VVELPIRNRAVKGSSPFSGLRWNHPPDKTATPWASGPEGCGGYAVSVTLCPRALSEAASPVFSTDFM
jgi:hypothetical protein